MEINWKGLSTNLDIDSVSKEYFDENESKEIHFYTNLRNKNQVSEEVLSDILVDYVSTRNAIEDEDTDIIRTTQLCFLCNVMDYCQRGWKVYIHNGNDIIEVKTSEIK